MKKFLITIILLGIVLAPLGAGVAHAEGEGGVIGKVAGFFSFGDQITFFIAEMGNMVLTLVSKILNIAGAVLNFSVDTTVNMGDFLSKVKVVDVGWKVFRDIANLFFIFILLWIGIRTILGLGGGEIKKLLLNVILMAMLINFSLFITKAIVDAGNVATLHFYNAMQPDLYENIKQPNGTYVKQPALDAQGHQMKAGLSDIYMEALKMQTFMGDGSSVSDAVASAGGFMNQFTKIFVATTLGSVFFLVAAFVFFAAAVLFIIRAVVLMLVMLLSPLAFVAQILPNGQAQSLAKQWWHALFSQTFFAPLYMALTYAVAKAIQSGGFSNLLNITGNQASFAAVLTAPASDNVAIIVNYVILIILMAATLLIATKLGAYGSGMVMGWGKGLQKWGQGAVAGLAGGIAARGIGGLARAATNSDALKASTNPLARAALRTADRLQSMKIGGKSYKEQQEKGTFFQVGEKEAEENMKEMRGKPGEQARYMSKLTPRLQEKMYEKLSARDRAAVETAKDTGGGSILSDIVIKGLRERLSVEEREKTEKEIKKSSKEEAAEALEGAADAIAKALKEALATGQTNPLVAGVKHGDITYKLSPTPGAENEMSAEDLVNKITDKDITKYKPETLKTIAPFLKKSHWKAIGEEKENLTPAEKKTLFDERMKPLIRSLGGGFGSTISYDPTFVVNEDTVKEELDEFSAEDIAGFKNDLKMSPLLVRHYTQQILAAMAKKGIDDDAAESIKESIVTAGMAGARVRGLSTSQQSNFSKMRHWLATSPAGLDNF